MIDPSPEQIAAECDRLVAEWGDGIQHDGEPPLPDEWFPRVLQTLKQSAALARLPRVPLADQMDVERTHRLANLPHAFQSDPQETGFCVCGFPEDNLRLHGSRVPLAKKAEAEVADWRQIDTAPKDGTLVLVYSPSHGAFVAWNKGRGWHTEPGVYVRRPTHWMPLPPPPLAEEGARRPPLVVDQDLESRGGNQAVGSVSSPPQPATGVLRATAPEEK